MTITRVPSAATPHERSAAASALDSPANDALADRPARWMTTRRACGSKVINHQDETLGEIDDIVVDLARGRIAYAAMASGGFLGLGERMFAVPWTALRYNGARECFVMDARKEIFENAPSFDKDRWPTEAQPEWHDQVHLYYGAPLYWR